MRQTPFSQADFRGDRPPAYFPATEPNGACHGSSAEEKNPDKIEKKKRRRMEG